MCVCDSPTSNGFTHELWLRKARSTKWPIPVSGRNQFFSGAALWSEASGVCLVPAPLIEGPWRLLADAELDGIVGRGYVTSFDA